MAPLGKRGGKLSLADVRRKCHLLTVIRVWEEILIFISEMQTIASTQPLIPDQQVLVIPNHTTKYVDVEVTGNRAPYIGWSRSALHSEEGLNPFFVTNSIEQMGGGCMGTLFLPERHFQKQSYPLSIPICFVYAHSNTAVWMIDRSLITGNTAASSTDPKVRAAFRTLY